MHRWQHTELPFKLPHVNVLVYIEVVNFRRDCTGFELRITKDGTTAVPVDVTLSLETRQIYKQMLTDSSEISRNTTFLDSPPISRVYNLP